MYIAYRWLCRYKTLQPCSTWPGISKKRCAWIMSFAKKRMICNIQQNIRQKTHQTKTKTTLELNTFHLGISGKKIIFFGYWAAVSIEMAKILPILQWTTIKQPCAEQMNCSMVSIQGQFTILEALSLNHVEHVFVLFNSCYRIARSLSNDTKCKYQDICSFFIINVIPENFNECWLLDRCPVGEEVTRAYKRIAYELSPYDTSFTTLTI